MPPPRPPAQLSKTTPPQHLYSGLRCRTLRMLRFQPPGGRCDSLAPKRPAGPAPSDKPDLQMSLGKTESYTS